MQRFSHVLVISGTTIEYFPNVSVSARPTDMNHVVRVFASLHSDALYIL